MTSHPLPGRWRSLLPPVGAKRVAVRVTPDALRRVRAGHPWIFDRSIESTGHEGRPGDLAVVFDRSRRFAAIGLWDPTSPIRLRVLATGSPTTIDAMWIASRIVDAADRRTPLLADAGTDRAGDLGWRVVNGEGDGLPGLVVDQYARTAVVKLYTEAWWPHLPAVVDGVVETTGAATVVLRRARNVDAPSPDLADGAILVGDSTPSPVRFVENDLVFEADVVAGQKTGHFLDQRHNRRRFRDLAAGRRVLDVFSATGGFAVHAAAGGARSVLAVDRSSPTLAAVDRNRRHNLGRADVAACRVDAAAGDAFDVLARLGRERRRFDLVVVDPPSFTRRAGDVDGALRAYGRLTELALDVTEHGGTLVQASCSARVGVDAFHGAIGDAADRAGRRLVEIARTTHDLDHPASDLFPEGRYLKAGFWQVDR